MGQNELTRSQREEVEVKDGDLVPTGIGGLDEVLIGGVKQGNIVLVEGAPGSGKTTLAMEFIYRGAVDFDEPGLIVSFELSPQKLLRDAAGFGWDFKTLEEQGKVKIIYTSPLVILQELHAHDGVLATEIAKLGAKRFVIDGLTPLKLFGEQLNGRPFRDSLHVLVEGLQRSGVTAMLTREVPTDSNRGMGGDSHEQFVCDTIISLMQRPVRRGITRSLEVTKSRGQAYISGKHTMRIVANNGIQVFKRPQSRPLAITNQPTSTKRMSTGCAALDRMMGGGVLEGSITLVVGISGTGKTVAGAQFLMEGIKQGRKGLMVTLDEHVEQLKRNADGLGFEFSKAIDEGKLLVHYDSPLELELDVHFSDIVGLIERNGIDLIVVDSLAAYDAADTAESRDFIYALATYFKNRLATAYLNFETPELLGVSQISQELKASTVVDNIILLNYVEISTHLRRAITIPKSRGNNPIRETREFAIGRGGISLLDEDRGEAAEFDQVPQLPFSSYYGILARSPSRRSPIIEGHAINGNKMPESPKLKVDQARN